MSTKQKQNDTAVENKGKDNDAPGPRGDSAPTKSEALLVLEHLPPLPLVFVVLFCSGALWILGLRDAVATGKMILGEIDEAYLVSIQTVIGEALSRHEKSTETHKYRPPSLVLYEVDAVVRRLQGMEVHTGRLVRHSADYD
jgi:hypothetical protein